MSLFDRIFRQPSTKKVLPEENLATEITAYFLESLEPFRSRFLKHLGVEDVTGHWTVETQVKLYAPHQDWDKKIPDLVIRCAERSETVLVEVKINAGTTFAQVAGKWVPQTKLYQRYLESAQSQGELKAWHLATLTRWAPSKSLETTESVSVRFSHMAAWLGAAAKEASPDEAAVADLASQWALYMKQRRWAMVEITKRHIEAIEPMAELLPLLWDFVTAASDAAVVDNSPWKKKPGKKASSSEAPKGKAMWGPALIRASGEPDSLSIGCHYGLQQGKPFLRAVLGLWKWQPEPVLEPAWTREEWWGYQIILMEDMAHKVTAENHDSKILDKMQEQVAVALQRLAETS